MLDALRSTMFRAIETRASRGGLVASLPVHLNAFLGRPLAPRPELESRRAARARLVALGVEKTQRTAGLQAQATALPAEAAPVMVYFTKGRNVRELERVRETLDARGIIYQLLDVTGDEAALAFVMREAGCEDDDLPVVFVAGKAIGTFAALVAADVSGELAKWVWGENAAAPGPLGASTG